MVSPTVRNCHMIDSQVGYGSQVLGTLGQPLMVLQYSRRTLPFSADLRGDCRVSCERTKAVG